MYLLRGILLCIGTTALAATTYAAGCLSENDMRLLFNNHCGKALSVKANPSSAGIHVDPYYQIPAGTPASAATASYCLPVVNKNPSKQEMQLLISVAGEPNPQPTSYIVQWTQVKSKQTFGGFKLIDYWVPETPSGNPVSYPVDIVNNVYSASIPVGGYMRDAGCPSVIQP